MVHTLTNPVVHIDPTGSNLHAESAQLHQAGPIVPVALIGGIPAWAVTDEDTARTLLLDERLAKNIQHWKAWRNGTVPRNWPLLDVIGGSSMFNADGADHQRLRGMLRKEFTNRRVKALRPRIARLTTDLLDTLATRPPGHPVDLKDTFAFPLPMQVICELFGVPDDDMRARLRALSANLIDTTATEDAIRATRRDFHQILGDLVAAKRAQPGDDLTSGLISACDHGDLTPPELIDTLQLMVLAGHETTVNLLTHSVRALATHPDQLAQIRTGQLTWEHAIEESLRRDGPVSHLLFRFALEPITVGDILIQTGEPVMVALDAIGRDPSRHPQPDRFDLGRDDRSHLAFGHGPHLCIGAPLARLEAQIALPALFDRFPQLTLAIQPEDLEPVPTFVLKGVRALPVHLGPASAHRADDTVPAA